MVVGGLLLLALILGVVLWQGMTNDDDSQAPLVPPDSTVISDAVSLPSTTPPGPARIIAATTFDPGGDGDERPELASAAIDGDDSTSWKTLCYEDRFVNGKPGVGLIAQLDAPARGVASARIVSSPYQVKLFATTAADAPSQVDAWGEPLASEAGTEPDTIEATLPDGTTFVLVLFIELGEDPGCENPYRGQLAELRPA
jgi:hypothetical protein